MYGKVAKVLWAGITYLLADKAVDVIDSGAGAMDSAGVAAEKSANLAKWAVVGGGIYLSYRAAKTAGLIK